MIEIQKMAGPLGTATRTYFGRCEMPAQIADAVEDLACSCEEICEATPSQKRYISRERVLYAGYKDWYSQVFITRLKGGNFAVCVGDACGRQDASGREIIHGVYQADMGSGYYRECCERILGWYLAERAAESLADSIPA